MGDDNKSAAADDRGQRFPIIQSRPANVLGQVEYTEVFRVQIQRARRGELVLTCDFNVDESIAPFPYENVWIDARIVGWAGGVGQTLDSFTLDRFGLADFLWDDPESYEAITIETRQNLDGRNTNTSATALTRLALNVTGAYWR